MDMEKLAREAIALAKTGAAVLPQLATGAAIAEGILNVETSIRDEGGQAKDTAADLEAAHEELFNAMMAKGHDLSAALRG